LGDVQETAAKEPSRKPDGAAGVRWIIHRVPSQRSARVTVFSPPGPIDSPPTAIHVLEDVHETENSELLLEPDGVGTCSADHL
jgi:hypothetical protein